MFRLLPLTVTEARYFIRDLAELNLPRELGARAGFRIRLRKTLPKPFKDIRADPLIVHIRGADELPGANLRTNLRPQNARGGSNAPGP